MESKVIKSDFSGLNRLAKTIGGNEVIQIGIFGNKSNRFAAGSLKSSGGHRINRSKSVDLTNADLGAIHEFGSFKKHIPARSFLRMPLHQKAENIIGTMVQFIKEMVAKGNKSLMLKKLGIACENAIQQAFATKGFGMWREDSPATARRKKSTAPLIDTAQLRRSITSRVARPA